MGSGNGGELVLGGYDPAHITGNINWVPLTVDSYWQFTAASVSLDSKVYSVNSKAICDTGMDD